MKIDDPAMKAARMIHARFPFGPMPITETETATIIREAVKPTVDALRAIFDVQDSPCRHDHHGLCQEHNLRRNANGEAECQVPMARAILKEWENP